MEAVAQRANGPAAQASKTVVRLVSFVMEMRFFTVPMHDDGRAGFEPGGISWQENWGRKMKKLLWTFFCPNFPASLFPAQTRCRHLPDPASLPLPEQQH